MTRIYAVACIERLAITTTKDAQPDEHQDVERAVVKIVSVAGHAEDAIKRAKTLINASPLSKSEPAANVTIERIGIDVTSVQLQVEAE